MKNTVQFNLSIPKDLFSRIEKEAENLKISRSRLLRNALIDYFNSKDALQNDILPALEKEIADIKEALKNGGISLPSDNGSFEVSERKSETAKPQK